MKRNILHFLIFSVLILFISACRDIVKSSIIECNEEGIHYGEIRLTERSDSFWSYQPNQTRVYRSIGKEFELKEQEWEGQYWEEIVETPLDYLCSWNTAEPVIHQADLEYRSVNYSDPANRSARIDIELKVRPVYRNDSIFFEDAMTIITGRYQRFIVDNRNSFNNNLFEDNFEFTTDTIVLGKHFEDVYHTPNKPYSPLFAKGQGIVAFFDIYENLYVLERVE